MTFEGDGCPPVERPRGWRRRRLAYVMLPTGAALGAGAVIASGAIPAEDGTINACYSEGGNIRVVDGSSDCRRSEAFLSWNQKGIKGDIGPQGLAGPAGPSGASSPDLTPGPQSDIFLKLDGIAGESTDEQHPNETPLYRFKEAETVETITSGGGGAGAGRPKFEDIELTKPVDKGTPALIIKLASGQHIKNATIVFRKKGANPIEYLTYKLEDVLITSHEVSTPTNNGGAVEQLSLDFSKITISYRPQNPDGSAGAPISATYDRQAQKAG